MISELREAFTKRTDCLSHPLRGREGAQATKDCSDRCTMIMCGADCGCYFEPQVFSFCFTAHAVCSNHVPIMNAQCFYMAHIQRCTHDSHTFILHAHTHTHTGPATASGSSRQGVDVFRYDLLILLSRISLPTVFS